MLLLILCAALSPRLWFLLAKANERPRNIVLAIIVAVAVACRFGFLVWAARGVTELLVFPEGMFFIGCGFVMYSTYELVRKGDRRRLAEAAFGIFALVPALRVFEGITPFGYSIYFAMPLFLVFVVVISRCIKAATPALSSDRQRELVNYLLATEIVMLALICIPQRAQRTAMLKTSWGAMTSNQKRRTSRDKFSISSPSKNQGRQVAVVPEAPMLYALAGTEAPSSWYMVLPGMLSPHRKTFISEI